MCLECGASNPAGAETCENCGAVLPRPASLFQNLFELVIRPLKAMARIAAYAPIMQAFLVVVVAVLIAIIEGVSSLQRSYDYLLNLITQYQNGNPGPLQDSLAAGASADAPKPDLTTALPQLHDQLVNNPIALPGAGYIGAYFILLILSWLFLSIAMYYTARLLFNKDVPRTNFYSLASVAGFARIAYILTLLLLIPGLTNLMGWIISLGVLLLQLGLLLMGAKFSTGLSWGKAAVVVAIPALIMQFLLQLPL